MPEDFRSILNRVVTGHHLSLEEMETVIGSVMDGEHSEAEIAALLTALRMKGEAVSELVGAARAMQQRATAITPKRTGLLDTCGTGGDSLHTFNISTASALVAAAAGVPVAKHGNRSVSSSSGSACVLEALGVNIQLSPEQVARCIDEVGIGFCFAPLLHGAMKHAAPVRKQLGFRTIFNLLGPLTNPARAEFQLLGTNSCNNAHKLAQALSQLGRTNALVVCGNDELDEVSLWGETQVYLVQGSNIRSESWSPNQMKLADCQVRDLQAHSPAESAEIIRGVLAARSGPHRNMVLANASAALLASRHASTFADALGHVTAVLEEGKAAALLQNLVDWTNSQA